MDNTIEAHGELMASLLAKPPDAERVLAASKRFNDQLISSPYLDDTISERLLEDMVKSLYAVPLRFAPVLFCAMDLVRLCGTGLDAVAAPILAFYDQVARLAANYPAIRSMVESSFPDADSSALHDQLDRDHPGEFYSWHVIPWLTQTVANIARGSVRFRDHVRTLDGVRSLMQMTESSGFDADANSSEVRETLAGLSRALN